MKSIHESSFGKMYLGVCSQKEIPLDTYLPDSLVQSILLNQEDQKEPGPVVGWLLDQKDPQHGESLIPNTSECPRDGIGFTSLASVLETGSIPEPYYLSPKCCRGLLKRLVEHKRSHRVPEVLMTALKKQSRSENSTE